MENLNIKTIDIQAKEWFDKVNGNSYFAAIATINFGMTDEKTVKVPFQYGYGETYISEAVRQLQIDGILPNDKNVIFSPIRYIMEMGVILRTSKETKCTKSTVKSFIN